MEALEAKGVNLGLLLVKPTKVKVHVDNNGGTSEEKKDKNPAFESQERLVYQTAGLEALNQQA